MEILAVVAIIGVISVVVVPRTAKFIRRARDMSAIGTLTRELNKARLSSIQSGFNVCVQVDTDTTAKNRIRLASWVDRNPDFAKGTWTDTSVTPSVEVPEIDLGRVAVETNIHLGQPGGTLDSVDANVLFNTYPAPGDSMKAMLVFTPSGGIVVPLKSDSGLPTLTAGRGIYFQDPQGKNFFRVTIPSNISGKPRAEMYISPSGGDTRTGYYPADWRWQ